MRQLKYYLKIYFLIVSQYLKTRMQYKTDFWVGTVGLIMDNIRNIVVLWLIFKSINSLAGWTYYQMMFFYAFYLLATSPMQILFHNIWYLPYDLESGKFIIYYFRPINIMFYYNSQALGLYGIGQLLLGIALIIYTSMHIGIHWTALKLLLLLLTWFSAALTIVAMMVASFASGFWLIYSHPLSMLMFSIKEYGRYPLSIFNKFFKFIFTFIIPIGFISFYPGQLLLKPAQEISVLAYFSPVIGIVFFMLANALWKKGLNNYSGTGS